MKDRRKGFLIFLLVACLVATIYTGYLLFTHRTEPIIGAIIFAVDIGVLIWNISVLRKWRVGTRSIVAIAVIIALLGGTIGAFSGIKPFSTVKSEVVTWFQKAPSQPPEQQLSPPSGTIPSSPSTPPSPQPSPQPSVLRIAGYTDHQGCRWRIGLTSASIKGGTLKTSIFIINDGNQPALFEDWLVVVDSFSESYYPESGGDFYFYADPEAKQNGMVTKIYPTEKREGEVVFAISEYSGECSLCVADYMQNKLTLFDIPLAE
jgi:hypothetical protein